MVGSFFLGLGAYNAERTAGFRLCCFNLTRSLLMALLTNVTKIQVLNRWLPST